MYRSTLRHGEPSRSFESSEEIQDIAEVQSVDEPTDAIFANVQNIPWENSIQWESGNAQSTKLSQIDQIGANWKLRNMKWTERIRWDDTIPIPIPPMEINPHDGNLLFEELGQQMRVPDVANCRLPADKQKQMQEEKAKTRKRLIHPPHSTYAKKFFHEKIPFHLQSDKFFHRPELRDDDPVLRGGKVFRFSSMSKKKNHVSRNDIRTEKHLIPHNENFILVEYIEERPTVLMNPGMAFRVVHFWWPSQTMESPVVLRGQAIPLKENEVSGMLVDNPNQIPMTAMVCTLLKAPLFWHEPRLPGLFLIARSNNKQRFYIANVPELYLAGQVEPQLVVPTPKSTRATKFQNSCVQFQITQFLREHNISRFITSDIRRQFSNYSDSYLRSVLQHIAKYERRDGLLGEWVLDSNASNQMPSVEEFCLYQAMVASQEELRACGIKELNQVASISQALSKMTLVYEKRLQHLQQLVEDGIISSTCEDTHLGSLAKAVAIARFINEQMELTPWNLSSNYVHFHLNRTNKGGLALVGMGDPSGRGEAVSYIRKVSHRKKEQEKVAGTSADLRRIKYQEAGRLLLNLGYSQAKITSMTRAERVSRIRHFSTTSTCLLLKKFARPEIISQKHSQQYRYIQICKDIYNRQILALSCKMIQSSSSEEDNWNPEMEDLEQCIERDLCEPLGVPDAVGYGHLRTSATALYDAIDSMRLVEDTKKGNIGNEKSRESRNRIMDASATHLSKRKRVVLRRRVRQVDAEGMEVVEVKFCIHRSDIENYITRNRQDTLSLFFDEQERCWVKKSQCGRTDNVKVFKRRKRKFSMRDGKRSAKAMFRHQNADLCAQLEKIFYEAYFSSHGQYFRTYWNKVAKDEVEQGLSLDNIRDKLENFEYGNFTALLSDLQKIVLNSTRIHGPSSASSVTESAEVIYELVHEKLQAGDARSLD